MTIRAVTMHRVRRLAVQIFRYVILTGLAFVILYPFLIKVALAFMDIQDLSDATVRFIPKTLTLDNFIGAAEYMNYIPNLLRTIGYTLSISVVQVFFAMLAAYGFASFRFPGRRLLFGFVLLTLIVPPQAIILPLYLHFQSFDILGLFRLIFGKPLSLLGSPLPLYLLVATGLALCGNPSTDYAVHTILNHITDYGTTRFDMGYASALSTVLFLTMILCNKLVRRVLRSVGN